MFFKSETYNFTTFRGCHFTTLYGSKLKYVNSSDQFSLGEVLLWDIFNNYRTDKNRYLHKYSEKKLIIKVLST